MGSPRFTKKTEACGYDEGTPFDDTPSADNIEDARISRVVIWCADGIDGFQFFYTPENMNAIKRGGDGTRHELVLDENEVVTMVQGSYAEEWFTNLIFVTNKRTWGPIGLPNPVNFTWSAMENVPAHLAPHMVLLSFSGNASSYITMLQATFVDNRKRRHQERLKYKQCNEMAGSIPLSPFTTNLMSPIVTLCVGPEGIKFYTNEVLLCQLPFFNAALNGGFKEATDRTINMPNDEASMISALIEFLYTGNYTYPYTILPKFGHVSKDLTPPTATLAEGKFHVGVCAVARKYDALILKDTAWTNFGGVLRDLGDVDKLLLWKAAYNESFQFPQWDERLDPSEGVGGVRDWVRVLLKDHSQELESALEGDTQLALDLFRLITAGEG